MAPAAQPGARQKDLLAGLVVALALIPEAVAFSIIAGVPPGVGLYASVIICGALALVGGRPGMISGATAAVAVTVVTLVRHHGLPALLQATALMGVIQLVAALAGAHRLLRFVPTAVVKGFVNALAIMILLAQLPTLERGGWATLGMTAIGLALIYGVPFLTRAVPAALVAVVVVTLLSLATHAPVIHVADLGRLPDGLPRFMRPTLPDQSAWAAIVPVSLTMAVVGLLETLMTAQILDGLTGTPSDKRREIAGQGLANILASLFGGMGGCAMIGQTFVNYHGGGRGRLSSLTASLALLAMLVAGGRWVGVVPMPALVAVMVSVSIGAFDWSSLGWARHDRRSFAVMVSTVLVSLATRNLSLGVLAGVLIFQGLALVRPGRASAAQD